MLELFLVTVLAGIATLYIWNKRSIIEIKVKNLFTFVCVCLLCNLLSLHKWTSFKNYYNISSYSPWDEDHIYYERSMLYDKGLHDLRDVEICSRCKLYKGNSSQNDEVIYRKLDR